MNKKIFYGLILLITLSLSLGVVSASDNFANETIGASLETPTNDIQLETSGSNSASEIKEIEKTISRYEKRLSDEQSKVNKDEYIDFEQMGFDKIFSFYIAFISCFSCCEVFLP